MHLSYALELPKRRGDVQKALRIPREASYAISIKNPDKGSPEYAGLQDEDKAEYPKSENGNAKVSHGSGEIVLLRAE
jgi:hypothetical protein